MTILDTSNSRSFEREGQQGVATFAPDAVAYVREHYDRRAIEMPWQRRYVNRFPIG